MPAVIRNSGIQDIEGIRELQRKIYPTIPAWSLNQFEQHLSAFPAGQFVAVFEGKIVGAASSLIVLWDDYGLDHNWKEDTGNGSFSTHNIAGKTLYGAEVFVDPTVRRQGIGRSLYAARRRLCRELKLKRIIAAGRLPGFHKYAGAMSPETYAMKVIWGDIDDMVLRFQLREGFQFCGVIDGYIPEDAESRGYAALIVWLNPAYHARPIIP
jgi:GNAT superfamily N-acetyltransferase